MLVRAVRDNRYGKASFCIHLDDVPHNILFIMEDPL